MEAQRSLCVPRAATEPCPAVQLPCTRPRSLGRPVSPDSWRGVKAQPHLPLRFHSNSFFNDSYLSRATKKILLHFKQGLSICWPLAPVTLVRSRWYSLMVKRPSFGSAQNVMCYWWLVLFSLQSLRCAPMCTLLLTPNLVTNSITKPRQCFCQKAIS